MPPDPGTPAARAAHAGLQYSPARHECVSRKVSPLIIRRDGPGMFPGRRQTQEPEQPEPASPAELRLDKIQQWRFDKLLAAGFTETQALWLALDRGVDLHKAVALRAKTKLAFKILS